MWPIPDGPRVAGRSSESALPPPELDEAQWRMWAKKAPSRGHCAKASPMLGGQRASRPWKQRTRQESPGSLDETVTGPRWEQK